VQAFESGVQDGRVDVSCLQLYHGPFLDGFHGEELWGLELSGYVYLPVVFRDFP
jgi:hypothetical protein